MLSQPALLVWESGRHSPCSKEAKGCAALGGRGSAQSRGKGEDWHLPGSGRTARRALRSKKFKRAGQALLQEHCKAAHRVC